MVSLTEVQSSNSLIPSTLPPRLVGVFVGATSGIGESTLKTFARYAKQPRAYFVGRSQDAADRIAAECKALNPDGEYIFIQADISLIRVVDDVCEQIKAKESALNILFLSAGVPLLDRSETPEGIHLLAALTYYARMRFITNMLPLLQSGTSLRRVVSVAGGTHEGLLHPTDFPALRIPLKELRGHLASLVTLGLEAVSKMATDVSFVHCHPGSVDTPLFRHMHSQPGKQSPFQACMVPIDESGERQVYLATSSRFPAKQGNSAPVLLPDGSGISVDTTGIIGGGVYSVGSDCEPASSDVIQLLAELRDKGMLEEVWNHTEEEFKRICGSR
ncbi:hypothetical protein GX51_02469 [Blastomyces parvus]|uniref:Ketoreductase (KR) domain-containing protein n=1 Tax=Blastomyces parvus TaxID=2060905 RepID=A0A2B7XC15_9EURO|nr:hypothetical protein GX51_02469 [Blastomyces parvus]